MNYITCATRKNAPKINVLVCENKCQHAETCKPYLSYLETTPVNFSANDFSHGGEEDLTSTKSSDTKEEALLTVGK